MVTQALDRHRAAGAAPDTVVSLDDARVGDVLGPITLAVAAGERVAFVGRNGIGKTTLLKVMAGLRPPSSGTATTAETIGYVPQSYRASLLPWFRVRDNLALGLRGSRRGTLPSPVQEALEIVPLAPDLLERRPSRLSGGEQQLVALARALVGRPRLLVLDEPFSALDAPTRIRLRQTLSARLAPTTAIVLVSHDLEDVLTLAQRILVLDGRPAGIVADLRARAGLHASIRTQLTEHLTRAS